jgi:hypothetical protein
MKPTPANLHKLEEVFKALSYTVRYEKGNFQSGYCLVEDRKVVVVNKFFDVQGRFMTLMDILANLDFDPNSLPEKSRQFCDQLYRQAVIPQDSE